MYENLYLKIQTCFLNILKDLHCNQKNNLHLFVHFFPNKTCLTVKSEATISSCCDTDEYPWNVSIANKQRGGQTKALNAHNKLVHITDQVTLIQRIFLKNWFLLHELTHPFWIKCEHSGFIVK